jgi:(4S)-4-hydroxy-5-phosphonooxypentane-2,3-dione isomerase
VRETFLKLVRMNAATSLEAEAGCLRFDVLAPLETGGPDVLLYEVYADRAAFDAHLASPHFLAFDRATREMVTAKTVREFRIEAPLEARREAAAAIGLMASRRGLEPLTPGLGNLCSIQLSYRDSSFQRRPSRPYGQGDPRAACP